MKDNAEVVEYDEKDLPKHLSDAEFYFIDMFKCKKKKEQTDEEKKESDEPFEPQYDEDEVIELAPVQTI